MIMHQDLKGWAALVAVVCTCHLLMSIGRVQAFHDEADRYLDAQMTALTGNLLKLHDSADLSEQVDAIAKGLDQATAENPRLVESISQALHMEAIQHTSQQTRRRKRSLADLLEDSTGPKPWSANPSSTATLVVHAQRRANPQAILAQASNDFVRLSSYARDDMMRASRQLDMDRPGMARKTANAISRIVQAIANYGLAVIDFVYAAPEFIERIPAVGQQIKQLKERGEPIIRVIDLLRHTTNLLKLQHADPASRRPHRMMRTQDNSSSNDLSELSMTEEERQRKMAELKRLISEAGIAAIKSIGKRMVISWGLAKLLDDKKANLEINTRTFYMIVTYVLRDRKN